MSSILEAVKKDPERAGGSTFTPPPDGFDGPTSPSGGRRGSTPRWLAVLMVVVGGFAVGALAARWISSEDDFSGSVIAEVEGEPEQPDVATAEPVTPPPQTAESKHAPSRERPKREDAAVDRSERARVAPAAPVPPERPDDASAAVEPAASEASREAAATQPRASEAAASARAAAPVGAVEQPRASARPPADAAPAIKVPVEILDPADPSPTPRAPEVQVAAKPTSHPVAPRPPDPPPNPFISVDRKRAAEVLSVRMPGDERAPSASAKLPVPPAPRATPSRVTAITETGAPASTESSPDVHLLFVMWARDPEERMVSMRFGQGVMAVAREGDVVEGMQVGSIHPDAVELTWTGRRFRVEVDRF